MRPRLESRVKLSSVEELTNALYLRIEEAEKMLPLPPEEGGSAPDPQVAESRQPARSQPQPTSPSVGKSNTAPGSGGQRQQRRFIVNPLDKH